MLDPGIYGVAPGIDFPQAVIQGLLQRNSGKSPDNLARMHVFVNTRRMQRRLREILDQGPACLLPRIQVVSDLGQGVFMSDITAPASPLRRRLELAQLISRLIDSQPDLAPRSAIFDLADSLAALLDEMHGEGVGPEKLSELDVEDQSGHWQRALKFLMLIQPFYQPDQKTAPDPELRQRIAVERQIALWRKCPPSHPVIVAGSTGSRGTTRLLMEAVANLPQGAVILPGFDFEMPESVWGSLRDSPAAQDHPQYRFQHLMNDLEIAPGSIRPWIEDLAPANRARNKVVSLALRPAPITDAWMREGPDLENLETAMASVSLLEAASPRAEATAIAFKLRECAETGRVAALISPDRQLTRQVSAALDRWGIEADDSAGLPLALSPPGRFLRHVSSLFGQKLTSEALLVLLKHPLTNTGSGDRGLHLLWTRELELFLRRHGPPFPTKQSLLKWARQRNDDDGRIPWATWLGDLFAGLEGLSQRRLGTHVEHLMQLAEALAAGPAAKGAGELWEKPAGIEARKCMDALQDEAVYGGALSTGDFNALLSYVLNKGEVRDPTRPHPGIMIWGTLEARNQSADLMILGGLNEGVWPEIPAPDPWLNRDMRKQAGLLLPDRRIGLSAHDFQQAIAGQEVLLTRAIRDNESETVPSRWLNRLTNLLGGLKNNGGRLALKEMRKRGNAILADAGKLEDFEPVPAAFRPSPCPPVAARPKKLSVTRIKTLIRDPYAIYAEYVLKLRPLEPLRQEPDAPLRGTVLHKILELFIAGRKEETRTEAKARLMQIADQVLEAEAPWPTARRIWRAKLARVSDSFLAGEEARSAKARNIGLEESGACRIDSLGFTLTAKADRFDRADDGRVFIYDYKTGNPPSAKEQKHFDKQLLLTAAMVEKGGFALLGKSPVAEAVYIGLGSNPKDVPAPLADCDSTTVWQGLEKLIGRYLTPTQGYTSSRAMQSMRYGAEYQHLARFGEWDLSAEPVPEKLK